MLRMSSILLVLVLVIGCAAETGITRKDAPIAPIPVTADNPPNIVIGSKFFYMHTNAVTGKTSLTFTRVKSKVNWMGTPAYVIEANKQDETTKEFATYAYTVIDSHLNPLAMMDGKGNLTLVTVGKSTVITTQGNKTISPAVTIYDWPIKAGKSFSTTYEILNKSDSKTYQISDQVKVEERTVLRNKLSLSMPTYKIYRTTPGTIEIRYYSPELGTDVKQEITNTLENSAGVSAYVVDLVGYSIPGLPPKGERFN